jgi:hypothetical protein
VISDHHSSSQDYVNLALLLKALPNPVVMYNVEQNELFNFKVFQDALIAFQNIDIVKAFEYYDLKNKERTK